MKLLIPTLIASAFASAAVAAPCNISDFKDSDTGTYNASQYYSYLEQISEQEWNNKKTDLTAGAVYDGIAANLSYSDMKSRVRSKLTQLNVQQGSQTALAWSRSYLGTEGLKSYQRCVGGLDLSMSKFDDTDARVLVTWNPAGNQTLPAPQVASFSNVANEEEISTELSPARLGNLQFEKEVRLRKTDPTKSASFTFSAVGFAKIAFVPEPPPKVVTQLISVPAPRCVSRFSSVPANAFTTCQIVEQSVTPNGDGVLTLAFTIPRIDLSQMDDGQHTDRVRGVLFTSWCGQQRMDHGFGAAGSPGWSSAVAFTMDCPIRKGVPVVVRVEATPRPSTLMQSSGPAELGVTTVFRN